MTKQIFKQEVFYTRNNSFENIFDLQLAKKKIQKIYKIV